MRYNSRERLEAWRDRGEWPSIHDAIFELIQQRSAGGPYLDLCCSTGLLGSRLMAVGEDAVGIEASDADNALRQEFGVPMRVQPLRISRDTLEATLEVVRHFEVRSVVARRCISEIFANDMDWGPLFVNALASCGVHEMFLQGRRVQPNATHPIPDIKKELEVLACPALSVVVTEGELAYCRIER